ncbi:MAG: hypothetical protein ACUVSK_05435 [Desulfotomaculales bacterium]
MLAISRAPGHYGVKPTAWGLLPPLDSIFRFCISLSEGRFEGKSNDGRYGGQRAGFCAWSRGSPGFFQTPGSGLFSFAYLCAPACRKKSLSEMIAGNKVLNFLDRLGRDLKEEGGL